MAGSQFNACRQEVYDPVQLGLSAKVLTATTNSNAFGVAGFNQLTIDIEHTYGAATAITFYLEERRAGAAVWCRKQVIVSISAAGVETTADGQISVTNRATSAGYSLDFRINCAGEMRIASLTGTAANSSDLATVYATIAVI